MTGLHRSPRRDRMLELLEHGAPLGVARAAAGVTRAELAEWWRRGAPGTRAGRDKDFRAWRLRAEQAIAELEARSLAAVIEAAGEDWRAHAWLLERRWPHRWARSAPRSSRSTATPAPAPPVAPVEDAETPNPFAEIDELAAKRRNA